jgi:macrolide transport system ATP-binding/permease protein
MLTGAIEFRNVTFQYDRAAEPLFERLTCRLPAGWTGLVGANGAGKTTFLRLAVGRLRPRVGQVDGPDGAFYGEQRTDKAPPGFLAFLESPGADACRLRGALRIDPSWRNRWETLSHGERKRAQVGVMLWRRPPVLALDEPTNHLDREARRLLTKALRSFRGVGLLVSHDRELLDSLCERCLFLDPPDAVLRPGGYTDGTREAAREQGSLARLREDARKQRKRLEREARRRRSEAARAKRKDSKRRLDPKDRDGRAKIDMARLTGKDAAATRRLKRMEDRAARARAAEESVRVRKEYGTGITLPGEVAHRDFLFRLDAGTLALGRRRLDHPALAMAPRDRIALAGPNGAGKSTLAARILDVLDLPERRLVYIPQEFDLGASAALLDEARHLPREELGRMMIVTSRLGSRPERLLASDTPSPGEVRKLLLAVGIAREPWLVILDEPTNHMDLPSVVCLEQALACFPGGLLLVSHDERFLCSLTDIRWEIERAEGDPNLFRLRES